MPLYRWHALPCLAGHVPPAALRAPGFNSGVALGRCRIAAFLSRCAAEAGHVLLPWKMRPADIPELLRRAAQTRTVDRMVKYADEAGWNDIAHELAEAKIVAEQEG